MNKIFIGLIILIAGIVTVQIFKHVKPQWKPKPPVVDCEQQKIDLFTGNVEELYSDARLDSANLDYTVFRRAMNGYYILKGDGQVSKPIVSIVDFQLPSSEKRLWVIDVENKELLFNSLVAHGRGTGELTAESFSNAAQSNMSSLGFYVTSDLYNGKHGLSLIVDGMEKGFNDSARSRAIVMHGAGYVSEGFVDKVGRLGRSLGCPAIPSEVCSDIVCAICERSVLFIYYPDKKYLAESEYLVEEDAYEAYAAQSSFNCKKNEEIASVWPALFDFSK